MLITGDGNSRRIPRYLPIKAPEFQRKVMTRTSALGWCPTCGNCLENDDSCPDCRETDHLVRSVVGCQTINRMEDGLEYDREDLYDGTKEEEEESQDSSTMRGVSVPKLRGPNVRSLVVSSLASSFRSDLREAILRHQSSAQRTGFNNSEKSKLVLRGRSSAITRSLLKIEGIRRRRIRKKGLIRWVRKEEQGLFEIITWNVNGLRKRKNNILQLLEEEKPDILCMQEIKCPYDKLPRELNFHSKYGMVSNGGSCQSLHGTGDVV